MAKKVRFFYQKILLVFFSLLAAPICKMFGFGPSAWANNCCHENSNPCAKTYCTIGDTKYISCGTNSLQKQVCQSCTYQRTTGDYTGACSEFRCEDTAGSIWVDTGSCTTYSNECTAGTTSSRSCTDDIGLGTQSRSCNTITAGSKTYYMWGAYSSCSYTECRISTDVLEAGKCYCTKSCALADEPNGYGAMVAALRTGSVCPLSSSSSS